VGGLRRLVLRPGDKAVFQLDEAEDFTTAFWGCVLGGVVPVPLSVPPSYAAAPAFVDKLQNVWKMLKGPVVISEGAVAADLRALASTNGLHDLRVHTVSELIDGPADTHWHEPAPEDLAVLLLTSGSTGVPKAVMQSHAALLHRSAATRQMLGLTSEDVILNWLPLDHVGGIVMMSALAVFLRCEQVNGATSAVLQDPLKWLDWIQRYRVTKSWAPNFAFALVNARADEIASRRWDLSTVRVLINAGEAVVAKTARRFLSLLAPYGLSPGAMHPVWGMSETSSGVTFSTDFTVGTTSDDDLFVDVGAPVPGFAMRIVDAAGRLVPERTIGSLQVSGPSVTTGYYENPIANAESFTADGWFKTGDLGVMRDGRLTITGREKDVIIINGLNHYSHEIEKIVEDTPGVEVSFTAAFAVRTPGSNTDQLAICFGPSPAVTGDEALANLLRDIRTRVAQQIGVQPTYLLPVHRGEIPKTAIGKIQRAELARRLKAGDFDERLRRVDVLLGNANTIPDWFAQRVWRPRRLDVSPRQRRGVLVFLDDAGIGTRAIAALAAAGADCVTVTRGHTFGRLGRWAYAVPPSDAASYRRLLDEVERDGVPVDTLLHCWTSDVRPAIESVAALEAAQDDGLFSFLALGSAIAGRDPHPHLTILAASRQSQVVADSDPAGPHATAPGVLKTLPQELAGITCRHVDLDSAASIDAAAETIIDELNALDNETEVAYRQGVRYVSRLAPIDLTAPSSGGLPVKHGGCYVITGGLGALGSMVARELLERFNARLLLLGRTRIDETPSAGAAQERASRLEALQAAGSVVYEAVDIADAAALASVVDRARCTWQQDLDGIVHLAGQYDERLMADETPAHALAEIRAKLSGTWALRQLVAGRSDALFIAFSSVNGFFGGFSAAAYSAGNAYLDASAEAERRRGAPAASFAWSLWDDVGMSAGYAMKDLSRARGYLPIGMSEGHASFCAALRSVQGHVLIGVDLASPHMRKFAEAAPHPVQQIVVTLRDKAPESVDRVASLRLQDDFGHDIAADIQREAHVAAEASGAPRHPTEAPLTDLEQAIARIWQQVLCVAVVDPDSNFFEMGGTSLLMAQAHRRMSDVFGAQLVMTDLFRYPTVRALCRYLTANGHADSAAHVDRERGRRRRKILRRPVGRGN
jgi:acyl-CoA synthetase (AMP-forming)/AMP-acid ligase II/NADP-dependent 3-hydroxy acid dehydrogenase YdfG